MERDRNQREPAAPNFLSFGIYLCLAAVIISLLFASCTGGALYEPKDAATPSPTSLIPPPNTQE